MLYTVTKREVWTQLVVVEAANPQDALRRVSEDCEGSYSSKDFEYSCDMTPDTWTVEEGG